MMDAFQKFHSQSGDILQIDCAATSSKPLETDTQSTSSLDNLTSVVVRPVVTSRHWMTASPNPAKLGPPGNHFSWKNFQVGSCSGSAKGLSDSS